MSHQEYYKHNTKYSTFLETQDVTGFDKYVNIITKHCTPKSKVLDVGCGTGIALDSLIKHGIDCTGLEISKTSIDICKGKNLNCRLYDGNIIPYKNNSFDIVGCYNVLEHTNNPLSFLDEMKRVNKKNGYILMACPNFLSITNNYHHNTSGILQKIYNIYSFIRLTINNEPVFNRMEVVDREDFSPDDDAINITNPISIIKWARKNSMEIEYFSSQSIVRKGLLNILDFTPIKYFLGSVFIVLKNK